MTINSEQDLINFGKDFAKNLNSHIIELVGDVGAGKTTFVKGLAESLGCTEKITSPSFTISKTYALPENKTLVHYDFYRLDDPGLMAGDLAENLENENNIVVIEWGESIKNLLPKNHTIINITLNNDNTREIQITTPAT